MKISEVFIVLVVLLLTTSFISARQGGVKFFSGPRSYEKETKDYINKIKGEIIYVNQKKGFIAVFTEKIPIKSKLTLSKEWGKTISCEEKLSGKKELNKSDSLKCLISIEINETSATIRLTNLNSIKGFMWGDEQFNKWLKSELKVRSNIPKFSFLTKGGKKPSRNDNILNYQIGNSRPAKKVEIKVKPGNKPEKDSYFDWKDKFIMILIGIIIVMGLVLLFFKKIIFKRTII